MNNSFILLIISAEVLVEIKGFSNHIIYVINPFEQFNILDHLNDHFVILKVLLSMDGFKCQPLPSLYQHQHQVKTTPIYYFSLKQMVSLIHSFFFVWLESWHMHTMPKSLLLFTICIIIYQSVCSIIYTQCLLFFSLAIFSFLFSFC